MSPKTGRSLSVAIILVMVVLGAFITDDYGMSWDEAMQRSDNGKPVFEYVTGQQGNYLYPANNEKYHGAWFEFLLYGIEKIARLTTNRSIYLMRHFVTYLMFCLGAWWFVLTCRRLFKSEWIVLTGVVMYFLSPRLFADAFYNSKDIPFFVFYVGYIFTLLRYSNRPTVGNLLLHAFITGLLIDLRISGVVVIPLTIYFIVARSLASKPADSRTLLKRLLIYTVMSLVCVYVFWPILWEDPLYDFPAALMEMSHYHWNGIVLFDGEMVPASNLPWYYLPRWLLMTSPVFYLFTAAAGTLMILYRLIRKPLQVVVNNPEILVIPALFFGPAFAVVFLNSVIYDGWRHLYFIHAPLLLLSLYAISNLAVFIRRFNYGNLAGIAVLLAGITPVGIRMLEDHPYQMLYFNRVAARNLNEVRFKYEMDYWGLTFRAVIEHMAEHDSRPLIVYDSADFPGELTYEILPDRIRNKVRNATENEQADYYISNYKYMTKEFKCSDEVYWLVVDGAKVCFSCRLRK